MHYVASIQTKNVYVLVYKNRMSLDITYTKMHTGIIYTGFSMLYYILHNQIATKHALLSKTPSRNNQS